MSAADFVDNTEFFMHNLLDPKNKTGPFFLEFWQYLNVCIFQCGWTAGLLCSGHIQVLGPGKLEQDSVRSSQGQQRPKVSLQCSSLFHPTILQEDELCREDSEEQDWQDDLPSHIF